MPFVKSCETSNRLATGWFIWNATSKYVRNVNMVDLPKKFEGQKDAKDDNFDDT